MLRVQVLTHVPLYEQEALQAQLSMQDVHLHAILKLLENSQPPRARGVELAGDVPPFSHITLPTPADIE